MVRTLIKIALTIVGNAIGLLVVWLLLDDVHIEFSGFILALLIFTVAELVLEPLIEKLISEHAEKLRFVTSLVTTYLALLITDVVSDGLNITGVTTWILATLIVWVAVMLASVILTFLFARKVVKEVRD